MPGLQFSGSVEGIRISPSLLPQGQFPITRIDSLGVTVKGGDVRRHRSTPAIVGGILRLDNDFNIIDSTDDSTPVRQRVFYLGLQGGF